MSGCAGSMGVAAREEPVGVQVTSTPLFSPSKVSFRAPMTFSMEVEPSADTDVPSL